MIKKYKKLNILSRGVLNWMVHTKCTPIEETLLRVFSPALVSPYMPSKSDKTAHNVHGKNAFKDRVFLKRQEHKWWGKLMIPHWPLLLFALEENKIKHNSFATSFGVPLHCDAGRTPTGICWKAAAIRNCRGRQPGAERVRVVRRRGQTSDRLDRHPSYTDWQQQLV